MRTIGGGPRSRDVPPSPNHANGRTLSITMDLMCISSSTRKGASKQQSRHGCLVVYVTDLWPARVMGSSLVPLETHHVEELMHVKSIEAQIFTRWCGVEVRRKGTSSGVILVT
ncbi:hypothetical protein TNCV_1489671 [Trichonephila clavipes]|nr:hypothetical protein TNCV_1489671 [Trichonephila clavipes]